MVSAYLIGRLFEYIIKKYFEVNYHILAIRCAGSKPFDILMIEKGPIYLYFCQDINELKNIVQKFKEKDFVIVKVSKRTEYFCLKDGIVVLLQVYKYIDLMVLDKIFNLKIVYDIIDNIDKFVTLPSKDMAYRISIIECKSFIEYGKRPYIKPDQLSELINLAEHIKATLIIVVKRGKIVEAIHFKKGSEYYALPIEEVCY